MKDMNNMVMHMDDSTEDSMNDDMKTESDSINLMNQTDTI